MDSINFITLLRNREYENMLSVVIQFVLIIDIGIYQEMFYGRRANAFAFREACLTSL